MAIDVAEPVFPCLLRITVSSPYCLPLYHMFQNNLKTWKDRESIRSIDVMFYMLGIVVVVESIDFFIPWDIVIYKIIQSLLTPNSTYIT